MGISQYRPVYSTTTSGAETRLCLSNWLLLFLWEFKLDTVAIENYMKDVGSAFEINQRLETSLFAFYVVV